MKSLHFENLEAIIGGIMEHPDCKEWFWDFIDAANADQFNDAYGIVIKMQRGGCSNNPYSFD
jgi:hypothetical protein